MSKLVFFAAFICIAIPAWPQESSFEVAAIKPTAPDFRGRFMTMQGGHQVVVRNYTLQYMVAAAYSLPLRAVSGGPSWIDSDPYDILATTPGERRPSLDEQLAMLRNLLSDRFQLKFHREPREFSVLTLTVAKNGLKLTESNAAADEQPLLVNQVFPGE